MKNYNNFINENIDIDSEYIETIIYTVDEDAENENHDHDILVFDENEIDISILETYFPNEMSSLMLNKHFLKIDIDRFLEFENYETLKEYIVDNGEIDNEKIKDFLDFDGYGDFIDDSEYNTIETYITPIFLLNTYQNEEIILDEIIKSINFGKNINGINFNHDNALIKSILMGHKKISKYLIENGINIDSQNLDKNNALMISIKEKEYDITKMILETNIDINAYNHQGENALILACVMNDDEIIKLILEKHTEINQSNYEGYTALFHSVKNNNLEITKLLVKNNIDVDVVDDYERSVLDFIFNNRDIKNYDVELIKYLDKIGVPFDFEYVDDINIKKVSEIFPDKYKKYMINKKSSDFNL